MIYWQSKLSSICTWLTPQAKNNTGLYIVDLYVLKTEQSLHDKIVHVRVANDNKRKNIPIRRNLEVQSPIMVLKSKRKVESKYI